MSIYILIPLMHQLAYLRNGICSFNYQIDERNQDCPINYTTTISGLGQELAFLREISSFTENVNVLRRMQMYFVFSVLRHTHDDNPWRRRRRRLGCFLMNQSNFWACRYKLKTYCTLTWRFSHFHYYYYCYAPYQKILIRRVIIKISMYVHLYYCYAPYQNFLIRRVIIKISMYVH